MTTTALSDAELLAQARQGDEAAFTELYVRHHAAARRLASAYPRAGDPEDLVNGAFERILGALRRGAGPDEAFRAYLFVTLRRFATDQINRSNDEPIDEVPEPVRAEERNPHLDPTERQMVVSAYESLPERWQAVLWQTAVEGRQPRELAGVLGMSANAAAALAYRAREKLRQAYLQAHLQAAPRPQCEPHRSRLGAYVREGLSRRDRTATEAHLDGCEACRALVAELVDVNRLLVRSLIPLFDAVGAQLGAAAVAGGATAAAGASGIAGTSGVAGSAGGSGISGTGPALLAKRLISKARANPTIAAGVVAAVAGLALALVAVRGGDQRALPSELSPDVEEERPGRPEGPEGPEPPEEPPTAVSTSPDEGEPPPEATLRQPEPDIPDPADPTTTPPIQPSPPGLAPTPAPPPSSSSPPSPSPPSPSPPSPSPPSPSPPTSPPPPTPTPPPERPALVAVWLRASTQLHVTLTNNTGRPTSALLVQVNLQGGAQITGRPSGCSASLALIRSASCSVGPLEPGEVAVVQVPVRVTGSDQLAATRVCGSAFLGLDCLTGVLAQVTTALLG